MKSEAISVVVPCYNEEQNIQGNLKKIYNYLESRFGVFEIIVVNDGSTDKTVKEIKKLKEDLHLRVIDNDVNEGKGKAVKQGVLESSCELVMFLDADLGIPIEELEKFVREIKNGYDIVIASRFIPGLRILRPILLHRRVMEKIFRLLRIIITNDWKIRDTQCGFKLFHREAAMKIFQKVTVKRFAFDAEVVFIANRLGHKIKELPIALQNPPGSHIRLLYDPFNMFLDLIKIRTNWWRGKYRQNF